MITNIYFDLGDTLGSVILEGPPFRIAEFNTFQFSIEVLKSLQDNDISLGIISNTGIDAGTDVDSILGPTGLLKYFTNQARRIYSNDVGVKKPSPAIFEIAAARAGLIDAAGREKCLFVGEDSSERLAAVNFGLRACPHPLLINEILAGEDLFFFEVEPAKPAEDSRWFDNVRNQVGFVPGQISSRGQQIRGVGSARSRMQLIGNGFNVQILGQANDPITSDLYLLRDDSPPGTTESFASVQKFEGNDSRLLLRRTSEGFLAAIPGDQSVERFHFKGAYHGHHSKLVLNPFLLDQSNSSISDLETFSGVFPRRFDFSDLVIQEIAAISPAEILNDVRRYCGEVQLSPANDTRIRSRHVHHNHNQVAVEQLVADLRLLGGDRLQVRLHQFSHEGRTLYNVEAELQGTSDELVLVTAHLDSTAANSEHYNPGSDVAPGADDDASGMAAVLAIAKCILNLSSSNQTARTIRFVLFNAEEHGLVGSRAYARLQRSLDANIAAVFQMDMIGYNIAEPESWEIHFGYSGNAIVENESASLAELIKKIAAKVSPQLEIPQLYRTAEGQVDPAEGRSDHAPFQELGFPACVVSEDFFIGPAADSPAPEPNINYHKKDDTFIDESYCAAIARAIAGATWVLANVANDHDSPSLHQFSNVPVSTSEGSSMSQNGMQRVSFRPDQLSERFSLNAHAASTEGLEGLSMPRESVVSAAEKYLDEAFSAPANMGFSEASDATVFERPALESAGIEEVELTDTVVAEYKQYHLGVLLYGSRIGVELANESRELVGISGQVVERPTGNPIASRSPADALGSVKEIVGLKGFERIEGLNAPKLVYRFGHASKKWELCYLFENIPLDQRFD